MDWFADFLQTGAFATPYLLAAMGAFVWIAAALVAPAMLMWVVIIVLALFPASSMLNAEGGLGFNIYAKGAGYLYFSLYELAFMLTAAAAWLRVRGSSEQLLAVADGSAHTGIWTNPLSKYYWAMLAIVLWHVTVSFFDSDMPLIAHFGKSGVVYMLMQGLFIAALVTVVNDGQKLQQLVLVVCFAVGLRMVWGVFRFVFLGGDHVAYDNVESGQTMRLTFWDINDSIWAMLVACGLMWVGLVNEGLTRWRRVLLLGLALFLLGIVALSARRTAQGGAVLALLTMMFILPRGRRWPVLAAFAIAVPLAWLQLQARMGSDQTLLAKMTDARGQYLVDRRYERFYELRTAWRTMAEHPVLGVGPAGSFSVPSHVGLEYHKGNYGFVHSGFGHVMLKTGILGVLVFCGLLAAYLRVWWQGWKVARPYSRPLLAASICAFAASVPNLVVGTPLIELRTMLLLGVVFAIPLLVIRTQPLGTNVGSSLEPFAAGHERALASS